MYRKEVLPNGLTLLMEEMPNLRSVSLGVWLKQGSRHERPEENGISHFIEHLLFKGTERRTSAEIAKTIDTIGGQCDASTAKEFTCFYARALDEHLPVALDLLGDIVLHPRFEPTDIEKERKVIFEEIKSLEDNPVELIHDLFIESFWRSHSLGRPIQGTVESVGALTADRLMRFFREAYFTGNVLIAAAGRFDPERLLDMVRIAFEPMRREGGPRPVTPPDAHPGVVTREKRELEQLHLCLGVPAHRRSHEERYAGYVLETILGGSMSSRLFQRIREERGLAYSVHASINSFLDTGLLTIYAATRPEGGEEVLEQVFRELALLKEIPVEQAEVDAARARLKGSLMLALESSWSRMSNLARQEIYFGTQYSLDEVLQRIDRVTVADVQAMARRLLAPERCLVTAVGPVGRLRLTPERVRF